MAIPDYKWKPRTMRYQLSWVCEISWVLISKLQSLAIGNSAFSHLIWIGVQPWKLRMDGCASDEIDCAHGTGVLSMWFVILSANSIWRNMQNNSQVWWFLSKNPTFVPTRSWFVDFAKRSWVGRLVKFWEMVKCGFVPKWESGEEQIIISSSSVSQSKNLFLSPSLERVLFLSFSSFSL